jgi:hypothetical protein
MGNPVAPWARYTTYPATPRQPKNQAAIKTGSGCKLSGTGKKGRGIIICEAMKKVSGRSSNTSR